jgi:hypothetical protein
VTNKRPVDFAMERRDASWIVTDFRCNSTRPNLIARVHMDPLAVAEAARLEKLNTSLVAAAAVQAGGHTFYPIGLGSYGGIARRSRSALKAMARATLADSACTSTANTAGLVAESLAAVSREVVLGAAAGIPQLCERLLLPSWKQLPGPWVPSARNVAVGGMPSGRSFDVQEILSKGARPLEHILAAP